MLKPKIYALGKIWKSEANGQVYHGGGFVRPCAAALTTGCSRKLSYKMIQKVGDRDKTQWSIREIAFTIPANPMSDRVQMVIEYGEEKRLLV